MERIELFENTWCFDEGGVRFFLLTGTERAILIDSGMQTTVPKEILPKLKKGALDILDGKVEAKQVDMFGKAVNLYKTEAAGFLCQ